MTTMRKMGLRLVIEECEGTGKSMRSPRKGAQQRRQLLLLRGERHDSGYGGAARWKDTGLNFNQRLSPTFQNSEEEQDGELSPSGLMQFRGFSRAWRRAQKRVEALSPVVDDEEDLEADIEEGLEDENSHGFEVGARESRTCISSPRVRENSSFVAYIQIRRPAASGSSCTDAKWRPKLESIIEGEGAVGYEAVGRLGGRARSRLLESRLRVRNGDLGPP